MVQEGGFHVALEGLRILGKLAAGDDPENDTWLRDMLGDAELRRRLTPGVPGVAGLFNLLSVGGVPAWDAVGPMWCSLHSAWDPVGPLAARAK